jgi:hypothetical protein
MGIITSKGEKKYPLCHCCQRGREKNIKIKSFMVLPSMPKGENVGHSNLVLALISRRPIWSHHVMEWSLMQKGLIWAYHQTMKNNSDTKQ